MRFYINVLNNNELYHMIMWNGLDGRYAAVFTKIYFNLSLSYIGGNQFAYYLDSNAPAVNPFINLNIKGKI